MAAPRLNRLVAYLRALQMKASRIRRPGSLYAPDSLAKTSVQVPVACVSHGTAPTVLPARRPHRARVCETYEDGVSASMSDGRGECQGLLRLDSDATQRLAHLDSRLRSVSFGRLRGSTSSGAHVSSTSPPRVASLMPSLPEPPAPIMKRDRRVEMRRKKPRASESSIRASA